MPDGDDTAQYGPCSLVVGSLPNGLGMGCSLRCTRECAACARGARSWSGWVELRCWVVPPTTLCGTLVTFARAACVKDCRRSTCHDTRKHHSCPISGGLIGVGCRSANTRAELDCRPVTHAVSAPALRVRDLYVHVSAGVGVQVGSTLACVPRGLASVWGACRTRPSFSRDVASVVSAQWVDASVGMATAAVEVVAVAGRCRSLANVRTSGPQSSCRT